MRVVSLLVALVSLSGCLLPEEQPGELVGEYAIASELSDNTCGELALPAPIGVDYTVELRAEEGKAYWVLAEPPPHVGILRNNGQLEFRAERIWSVGAARRQSQSLAEMDPLALYMHDPTAPQAEPSPCTLRISELVRGTVLRDLEGRYGTDASGGDDFVGENELAISSASGAGCSIVLMSSGGPFERLPCAARYALHGTLIE